MRKYLLIILLLVGVTNIFAQRTSVRLTEYVNPLMGTTTLWDPADLGYQPTRRAWGGETFPGASMPNAMVQVTPVTMWRSGSGYQYEDTVIYAFAHTSKGHWNLCYAPFIAVTGEIDPDNYYSRYNHEKESAQPGYYQVYLEKYGINAELTSTLRCAYHKYTYTKGGDKKLLADLARSNERVRDWQIRQINDSVFAGYQRTGRQFYFYAYTSHKIESITALGEGKNQPLTINFKQGEDPDAPLEIRFGFSYVSEHQALKNLQAEMLGSSFQQVRQEASDSWETLLSKIRVSGGSQSEKETFYSTLYRSFLWPVLLSDADGTFIDANGKKVNKGFHYYSNPSFWDDYRNKLVLLGMLRPDVTADVISSITDRGSIEGYMPTFFHGDHASVFIAGSYLRGIRNFDVKKAYQLLLKNAFVPGKGGRPLLKEYLQKGWIPEQDVKDPKLETVANAAVTKTLEYAYDDYATALLAKVLGDQSSFKKLMTRSGNYKNLFDPETGLMRGRLANGQWISPFDAQQPYFEYMYREANAWQSSFFAPHDPQGLIRLYRSPTAFEKKLDSLFSIPWKGYEAHNLTGFIGQYCHGNQPDHSSPYYYYFVGKQPKAQLMLDSIMRHFYRMGPEKLAYAGMDDAGEMSAWYVFNAMGLYTFSPADPNYLITVPVFDRVDFSLGNSRFSILKKGRGPRIKAIRFDKHKLNGYVIGHDQLKRGGELIIETGQLK